MKTTLLVTVLMLAVGSSVAFASDKDAKNAKDTKASTVAAKPKDKPEHKTAPRKEKVALTGSYIKTDVRRNGQITDGPSPVAVIDSKTIQNSGAADLRQLLTRQGVSR